MMKANKELALYRLQKARETIEDARILAQAQRWNPCVNRLYYACFYAISALLIQEGLSSSKHSGVRSLFNQHFVKTNKVSKETAHIFNDLFERRQEGDYMDFVSFKESQVRPWISEAEAFVENIAVLIEKGK
ncbi:MAG: HEPN domain-containing protein [Phycisphaerae bacterium]